MKTQVMYKCSACGNAYELKDWSCDCYAGQELEEVLVVLDRTKQQLDNLEEDLEFYRDRLASIQKLVLDKVREVFVEELRDF